MKGFEKFEFDLPEALLVSLVKVFDGMDAGCLTAANTIALPDEQGVYLLLLGDEVVYIGKTDGEAGLQTRLTRHSATVLARRNLNPAEVTFKAIRVFVFTAVDLETQLIRHYSANSQVVWNKSGFGSNDPGRNRDDTKLEPDSFDALYPIDIDLELPDLGFSATTTVAEAFASIRLKVPYTFRHEMAAPRSRTPHTELVTATFAPPIPPYSVRQIVMLAFQVLPAGWQATLLAGRVVIYKEQKDYKHGDVLARS
jgi:Eco29kI restriction endonuclease